MSKTVKMKGNPVELVGNQPKVGETAPNFSAVDGSFKKVSLSDFKGKKILISSVPSLDTGVCAAQTKKFNEEAAKIKDIYFITISTDLPFAQKRFCDSEKISNILVLSDSVWHDFGTKFGLLIKDMGLLARAVIIISKDGKISYFQIVEEITEHPDYNAALKALKE